MGCGEPAIKEDWYLIAFPSPHPGAGRTMRKILLLLAYIGTALTGGIAHALEPTAAQLRFFETKVRPILAERCIKCHGPEKQWSGLRLDSREALIKGGELYGAAIIPGRPDASLLIRAVRHQNDELAMPPKEEDK